MRGNENFNCNGLFALFTQMREHESGTEREREMERYVELASLVLMCALVCVGASAE